MNNKNFNSLYGGNFNNFKDMLEEDVSDTSDYNVSLLNQIQGNQFQGNQFNHDKSGGFPNLGNLAKLANQAANAIKTGEKLANKATNVINKAEVVATKSQSVFNKLTGDTVNNCITTAQSMNLADLKVLIEQLQKILNDKLKI